MTTQNSILYVHDSFISKSRDPGTLGRDKQVVAPTGIMIIGWISFRCLYICNFFFFLLCMHAGSLLISLAYRLYTSGCDVLAVQGHRKQLMIPGTSRML